MNIQEIARADGLIADMYPVVVTGWGFEKHLLVWGDITADHMDELARVQAGCEEDVEWRLAHRTVPPGYCLPKNADTGVTTALTKLDGRSIAQLWMR
jgi:hypothetical protein